MLIGLASKVYIDYTTALREYDNLLTRYVSFFFYAANV